jgi:hypothetical protein
MPDPSCLCRRRRRLRYLSGLRVHSKRPLFSKHGVASVVAPLLQSYGGRLAGLSQMLIHGFDGPGRR